MENDLIYTLDPVIVAILFKTKSPEDTLEVFNEVSEGLFTVFEETVKEYMLENGLSEEDAKLVLNAEDFDKLPDRIQPYLKNVILQSKIEKNTKLFLKTYYDALIPKLNEQEKKELDDYLLERAAELKKQQDEIREGFNLMRKILEENGVNNYEELEAKFASKNEQGETPKINLGGVTSGNNLQAMNEPTQVQAAESVQAVSPTPVPVENAAVQTEVLAVPEVANVPSEQTTSPVVQNDTTVLETQQVEPVASVETVNAAEVVNTTTSNQEQQKTPEAFDWSSVIMGQVEGEKAPEVSNSNNSEVIQSVTNPEPVVQNTGEVDTTLQGTQPEPQKTASGVMDSLGINLESGTPESKPQ